MSELHHRPEYVTVRRTPAGAMQRTARYSPSGAEGVRARHAQRRWIPAALLVVVIAFGSWIRVDNLGTHEFNADELYHHYAGQSISQGQGPQLPSGLVYSRGIDVTRMAMISNRYVSPPELATRLPSTLFGIANLLLIAAIAWALGGPWVAVWSTLLLAIFPEAVIQSRQLRFYTYQLCFGLIGLYAVWKLVESAGRRPINDQRSVLMQWIWAGALGWALLMATRIQITTLSIAAGAMAALLVAAVLDLRAHGRRAFAYSVPLIAWILFIVGAVVAALLRPDIVRELMFRAQYVPVWAGGAGHALSYYYSLVESLPAIIALAPVVFVAVALWNSRLCLVLLTWFAVPVALHSFVFAWKGDRFIILAIPALLIAAAIAITISGQSLHGLLVDRLRRVGFGSAAAAMSLGALTAAALFAVFTTPAFSVARKAPAGAATVQQHNWRAVGERIRQLTAEHRVPVGTSEGLSSMFYWGGADFIVHRGAIEFAGTTFEPGDPDAYSGIPVYVTPGSIRERFGEHPFVLIGIDRVRWEHGTVEPALQEALRTEGEELCEGACGNMLLFRWPLAEAARTTASVPE